MRKHIRKVKRPVRNFRRLTATVVVTAVILAIAAISVLSRQADRKSQLAAKEQVVKARMASQDVHLDSQSVEQVQLTDEEARKLAGGLKELVNQSTEGLVEIQHADGSVSIDLDGRFQNVTVARVGKDGSLAQSCVDNPRAAGAFFGIDPKLIDPTVDGGGPNDAQRPAKVSPARNN